MRTILLLIALSACGQAPTDELAEVNLPSLTTCEKIEALNETGGSVLVKNAIRVVDGVEHSEISARFLPDSEYANVWTERIYLLGDFCSVTVSNWGSVVEYE